ncbi:MAG TPA: YebC/PmpR family DNA-binding transcriptional regulator [Balneolaceae bacterium]|nr:YebC/PmpR family DNA-binding transcriptional regulator [Balneolaceae bacterium]|tara:strand:- start:3842 stop:4564 length:723 start_codon:yes stop_codon:yes gene_type:complete
MGRIFEVRKAAKFARWDKMAKQFSRIGKEIVIAVKDGGPDPDSNPALRRAIQNGRGVNMPKDLIERAIKRAMGKDATNYDEVLYEGYAPHGVAVLVETATDNTTRTVGNVRPIFTKNGGNLGNSGSVAFQFTQVGSFKIKPGDFDEEELELELIDYGLTEMGESENEEGERILVIRCEFQEFGNMQHALEEKGVETITAETDWIPQSTVSLDDEKAEEVLSLIDKLEQDEDVQRVFHNLV